MSKRKKKGSWRFLGHDSATLSRYRSELADSNLRLLGVISGLSVVIALAGVVFMLLATHDIVKVIACGACGILCGAIYFISRWLIGNGKAHSARTVGPLIYLFSYTCLGLSIYLGAVASDDPAVLFVLFLMFVLIIFDRKPIENFLTALPPVAVFIALSFVYKSDDATVYDIAHCVLALASGLVVSWYKARLKVDNIIAGSQLKKANFTLYHTSTTDPLTSLPNRKLTFDKLAEVYKACEASSSDLGCIVMDIDNFKAYNDIYGHPNGDKLLSKVGRTLNDYAQAHGLTVGRIGGEEFMAVWKSDSSNPPERTAEALRRLIEQLNAPHDGSDTARIVTMSVGLYCGRLSSGQKPDHAYTLADRALYKAKESGKNCCWRYISEDAGYAPIER